MFARKKTFAERRWGLDAPSAQIIYDAPGDWIGALQAFVKLMDAPTVATVEALLVRVMQCVSIESEARGYQWRQSRNQRIAAQMLRRLMLWWKVKSAGEYVWKSAAEWWSELAIKRHEVREAVTYLQYVGVTVCQMDQPNRALHYRFDQYGRFVALVAEVYGVDVHLVRSKLLSKRVISDNGLSDVAADDAGSNSALSDVAANRGESVQDLAMHNNNTQQEQTPIQQQKQQHAKRGGGS